MVMQISLDKMCDYAKSVSVYNDGESRIYKVGEDKFNLICTEWKSMIFGAHEMPAYGVSLNDETVKAMKSGVWAEFSFGRELSSGGMPYEKLLINVQPEWTGFNLIRYTAKHGYDGRCFYYDLVNKDMSSFYDCLIK